MIDALSLLLLCFFLSVLSAFTFDLVDGDEVEEDPNPSPDELVLFVGVATWAVSSRLVVGSWVSEEFWDLTASLGLVGEWKTGV